MVTLKELERKQCTLTSGELQDEIEKACEFLPPEKREAFKKEIMIEIIKLIPRYCIPHKPRGGLI